MAVEIALTQGYVALVDDEDAPLVAGLRWQATPASNQKYGNGTWYATRSVWLSGERRKRTLRMHRVILGAHHGVDVDHVDGDGLNNRRNNIRLCTQSLNNANARFAVGVSGFRGVEPSRRRWKARIQVGGVVHYLGSFADEIAAARAYDVAALATFGEFARLNFPRLGERSAHRPAPLNFPSAA